VRVVQGATDEEEDRTETLHEVQADAFALVARTPHAKLASRQTYLCVCVFPFLALVKKKEEEP